MLLQGRERENKERGHLRREKIKTQSRRAGEGHKI
jgi:hypothetical protein